MLKNNKKDKSKSVLGSGFTLIELLVVIAIIGILSSVVLASLNSARAKGAHAAAQETGRGILPELVSCGNDNATGNSPTAGNGGGIVCAGHTVTWPTLPSGYTYSTSAGATGPVPSPSPGALAAGTFQFYLVNLPDAILCDMNTSSCK